MKELPHPFMERFNDVVHAEEVFAFVTRDTELQQKACVALESLLRETAEQKALAIARQSEDLANLFLACECAATSLLSQIKMWLCLKEGKGDEAWDQLIAAQDAALWAQRAHPGFASLRNYAHRLELIEKLIFPPQVFTSAGFLVNHQVCSICKQEYGECRHIAGRPYMGRFCSIRAEGLTIDHVSIVDEPADKRCRVTHFDVDGGRRNRMTWLVEPGEGKGTTEVIVARATSLNSDL